MPRPMTKDLLLSAFAGESMASIRYQIYAEVAEKEGFLNVARLFKAISYSEQVHARNHYNVLRGLNEEAKMVAGTPVGPGMTLKNLELAIRGEEYEVSEMYPAYLEVARLQGEREAELSFKHAYESEQVHARLYREAKNYVEKSSDLPMLGNAWVCKICGYTLIAAEPPTKCPICGATKERFASF
ncbi:MAG: rubrerythrin family protein [Desulfurococcaceae archaeon]